MRIKKKLKLKLKKYKMLKMFKKNLKFENMIYLFVMILITMFQEC